MMMKRLLCILLVTLVSGTMLTVDVADAARRSRAVRLRPASRAVTKPAPATTTTTTAKPAATTQSTQTTQQSATAATNSTAAPAATAATNSTAAPAATAASAAAGQNMTAGQRVAPAPSQGSSIGSTLLGVGAGAVGGYMLGSALSGPDAATAADTVAPAEPEGAQPQPAGQPAAAPAPAAPSPVSALLGYDTASYCAQISQGNAELLQQCTAAENEAAAAFRSCVAMSSGLNGIGSYEVLLRCLRTPVAR